MPSLKEVARADALEDIQKGVRRRVWAWGRPCESSRNSDRTPATGGLFLRWFPIAFGTLLRFSIHRGRNRQISPKLVN